MKKLVYVTALSLMTSATFAQKTNVKAAEKLADSKAAEARALATEARQHEETKADPYAWYVSGLIEQKDFDQKLALLQLQQTEEGEAIYAPLLAEVPFFLKAYELEKIPDAKGKVRTKYTKKVAEALKGHMGYLLNAGNYYLGAKEYEKCIQAFNSYLNIKSHELFANDKVVSEIDTLAKEVAFFTVLASYEGKLYDQAIAYANKYKDQDYKKDEIYQVLTATQLAKMDTVAALRTLEEGVRLFPQQGYYLGNIVNIYAQQGKTDEAIVYLEKAIEQDPTNTNFLQFMGVLYERKENWEKASEYYQKILAIKADDFDGNHNLGRMYYNQAVTLLGAEKIDKLIEDKARGLFTKSVPYLEAAYKENPDQVYYVLANVHDRLGNKARYDEIMAAHK